MIDWCVIIECGHIDGKHVVLVVYTEGWISTALENIQHNREMYTLQGRNEQFYKKIYWNAQKGSEKFARSSTQK